MFKKNKLTLSCICFSSYVMASTNCGDFKIRWIDGRKTIEQIEQVCVREDRAFSMDCISMIKKSCPFALLKKGKSISEMTQPIGSLSFNLCHSIEGSPQMYELKLGNEWKNFERCFWKQSKTFIDLSDLVELYKSRSVR